MVENSTLNAAKMETVILIKMLLVIFIGRKYKFFAAFIEIRKWKSEETGNV
jgi:hypothetical protein